jgi:hypothetical protein
MAETSIPRPAVESEADAYATIDKWSEEIDRLRSEMKDDQEEIVLLSSQTRAALTRIEATLDRIAADRMAAS